MKWFIDIFFPYEVTGLENLDNLEKKFILCSNHVSNLDPIFIIVVTKKKIRFLAKVELFRNFLLSYIDETVGKDKYMIDSIYPVSFENINDYVVKIVLNEYLQKH